jgi:hypothetical protein
MIHHSRQNAENGATMFRVIAAMVLVCSGLFTTGIARADDWTADKLRGQVLQLIDGNWQPLNRGMVVPDSRSIRTLANGRVTLSRGNETLDIGPDTQIQIYDKGGRKPFTTVKQSFGSVSVEAEVRQVRHFAVQTPYLAAVVKGTRFTVTSGKAGASVSVRRGHVAVEDKQDKTHVTLSVGQTASVGPATGGALEVEGRGKLPMVLDARGRPVGAERTAADLKAAEKAAAKADRDAARDADMAAEKTPTHTFEPGPGSSGPGPSGSGPSDGGKGKKP